MKAGKGLKSEMEVWEDRIKSGWQRFRGLEWRNKDFG